MAHPISEYQGSWVLLHFWASWCLPCVHEIPEWLELARGFNRDVRFVAVSWDDTWEEAHSIMPKPEKLPANVISLLDSTGKTAEEFGSFQLPESYLLNPEGKVVHKWIGPQVWSDPAMAEQIRGLIRRNSEGSDGD